MVPDMKRYKNNSSKNNKPAHHKRQNMTGTVFYKVTHLLLLKKLWGGVVLTLLLANSVIAQGNTEDSLFNNIRHLKRQGFYQEAFKTCQTLLKYRKSIYTNNHIRVAQTYSLLGNISNLMGKPFEELQYLNQALNIQEKLYGTYSARNTYLHINLANAYQTLKKYNKAIYHGKEALRTRPKGSYFLYMGLGLSYYQRVKYDSALFYYKKALRLKNKPGVLTNIGDTHLKLNEPFQALKYYLQATRDSLPFYTQVSVEYRKAKAWHAQAIIPDVPIQVFKVREIRALNFLQRVDSLLKARQRSLQNEKDKLVLGQWIQAITELGLTVSYRLYQQTTSTARRRWREQVFYFSERQKASVLLDDVTGKAATPIIRLQQIQQQLDDSTAILEYSFGKDALYAFAITKKQILLKALPQDSIKKHWLGYNRYLHIIMVTRCVRYTHQFYKWLVEPLYAVVGNKPRWLVMGGVLNIIPFETFCKYPGVDLKKVAFIDINYQKFPYLIWQHTISYASSATLAFLQATPRNYTWQFLGVAPGNYRNTKLYPALKHAPKEVTAIANMLQTRKHILLGENATIQQVLEQGKQARWLHFATHGVSSRQSDLNGMLLYDDKWLLKDIQNLKLQNDLVVMSSCSAIAGKFIKGEGLVAMTRSFIRAGARNIAYTLWSVNDRLAARLMTSFYKYLTQGMDYAHALRQAKLEFLRDPKPVYGYPGLWAVYLLEGRF